MFFSGTGTVTRVFGRRFVIIFFPLDANYCDAIFFLLGGWRVALCAAPFSRHILTCVRIAGLAINCCLVTLMVYIYIMLGGKIILFIQFKLHQHKWTNLSRFKKNFVKLWRSFSLGLGGGGGLIHWLNGLRKSRDTVPSRASSTFLELCSTLLVSLNCRISRYCEQYQYLCCSFIFTYIRYSAEV